MTCGLGAANNNGNDVTIKDYVFVRGDSITFNIRFPLSSAFLLNGTAFFTIRKTPSDATVIFTTDSPIMERLESGVVVGYETTLTLLPGESVNFVIQDNYYDIQIICPNNDPNHPGYPMFTRTIQMGAFSVIEDVTQRYA